MKSNGEELLSREFRWAFAEAISYLQGTQEGSILHMMRKVGFQDYPLQEHRDDSAESFFHVIKWNDPVAIAKILPIFEETLRRIRACPPILVNRLRQNCEHRVFIEGYEVTAEGQFVKPKMPF